ncbi:hypothetical protein J2Y60_003025 [Arcicella sp. BE140]|nr:hypothetical protein [Arcicella sp. BE51]MDR6812815.1 hypothetical protein [Arcicella sp. BE140]MDR6824127.1 hypothetical protein [Arcicella sp. BE139]
MVKNKFKNVMYLLLKCSKTNKQQLIFLESRKPKSERVGSEILNQNNNEKLF